MPQIRGCSGAYRWKRFTHAVIPRTSSTSAATTLQPRQLRATMPKYRAALRGRFAVSENGWLASFHTSQSRTYG